MKEHHPLTEHIPIKADQMEVSSDIAHNGLREKIVLYEDKIIEGRVRHAACLELGIKPQFRDFVLTNGGDPLDWMVRQHCKQHELSELEQIQLVASVLSHYKELPGATHKVLNTATGLSNRKVRAVDWLQEAGQLDPVLTGQLSIQEAMRSLGILGEQREVALGRNYGHGDKFDEATLPIQRYLRAWKRRNYEFRHVNPKEAQRRLKALQQLHTELEAAMADLEPRSVRPRHTTD